MSGSNYDIPIFILATDESIDQIKWSTDSKIAPYDEFNLD